MTVVDIHPHIISEDTDRYPITPLAGKRSEWSAKRSVTVEKMIESMDAAGVDKAAIVHSSTTYGFNCEYAADAVATYPDRFTGVFSVNVLEPDATEAMLKWYDQGMTGMRIFTRGSTFKEPWLALDDPRIFPCYELAGEKQISVAMNPTNHEFDQLETILKAFPQVSFVLDHLGKTDFTDGTPFAAAEPLWRLAQYANLHLKVATKNFVQAKDGKATSESVFGRLVSEFGANRIAWGSNFPAAKGNLPELVAIARDGLSALSDVDQEWILGKTALKLYPALASEKAAAD
ncbi:amidohydrolase family protein [Aliiruegeria lutimaris]|uniref:Predicted metal-dependent hydrolase, TIM-barrel fold n=1 Tax=Aliiruegeria lutimaris TaxID=571298 RepID=A0A1G9AFE3_9RHOB|nr:amidohydrolase family protein [Aliiruegeria lutimaris]SDK26066.1 Predicted metal-dependent hydrolase, TIM-barrel fold [Aliiruegeria lutimaris]